MTRIAALLSMVLVAAFLSTTTAPASSQSVVTPAQFRALSARAHALEAKFSVLRSVDIAVLQREVDDLTGTVSTLNQLNNCIVTLQVTRYENALSASDGSSVSFSYLDGTHESDQPSEPLLGLSHKKACESYWLAATDFSPIAVGG